MNTLNWKPTFKEKTMSKTFLVVFGCLIIFFATTLGSALIYFMKKDINKKVNCIISGFSAGIMISASIWSLIIPSISYSENYGKWSFVPAVIGIFAGCLIILMIDVFIKLSNKNNQESLKLKRFVFAVTLHNIPEAMAVGFAIGSAVGSGSNASFTGALILAIGIAIQNIPEGLAVSLPVYNYTKNKNKSFLIGTLSGSVEPIFAFLSVLIASSVKTLLPWFLAFSAGAMLFVSVEDLVPDAKYGETSHAGTWGFIAGFLLMMILDISLG